MGFDIASLNTLLQTLSTNKKAGLWLLIIIIVGGGAWFVTSLLKPEKKQEDCSYFIEQNRQLLNVFLEIKQGLKPFDSAAKPTSFIDDKESAFMLANNSISPVNVFYTGESLYEITSIDTVPKVKVKAKVKAKTKPIVVPSADSVFRKNTGTTKVQIVTNQSQQQAINKVIFKIDSVIKKQKFDSIRRVQAQQQKKGN